MDNTALKEGQYKVIQSLTDWSKWLISINFASATGCVVVLKVGVSPPVRIYLFGAVMFFAFSVFCSSVFVLLLARSVERVPLPNGIRFTWLAAVQLILFSLGLLMLLIWVWKFSTAVPPSAPSQL